MRRRADIVRYSLIALALTLPTRASAAHILLVADARADLELANVLRADGHDVETVTMDFTGGTNRRLAMSLDGYDAVFWSANGSGYGDAHTDANVFVNLSNFVIGGGRVFVTGYDAIASPYDPMLVTFIGGTGSRDVPPAPGPVANVESSLTIGVVDIRGLTPPNVGDSDCVTGLGTDTIPIVTAVGDTECVEWSVRTLGEGQVAFVTMSLTGSYWTTTSPTAAGAYNAAARNFAASADFTRGDPGAPTIEFDAPFSADEGSAVSIAVSIADLEGESFTFSWDLNGDGSFGEHAGLPTYLVPASSTDGPAALRFGVQAIDAAGNTSSRYRSLRIDNVAPTIESLPPATTSVGASFRYAIVAGDAAGARDPFTYSVAAGPFGMWVNASGVVEWTPSVVTPAGETVTLAVRVADGDMGETEQRWEMTVLPNHPPTAPIPVYPIDYIGILDPQPRLAVQNAEDADVDPLVYFFEIDTVATFDSPDLRQSGSIAEMPGFTAWELPEPLAIDRLYHWRVWANDGAVDGQARSAAFYVVHDPDALMDAGVSDAGASVRSDGGRAPGSAGCGCRAARRSSPSFFLVAIVIFVFRRRR